MIFVNWDGRPAISTSPSEAVAILEPGGAWTSVDGLDVFETGRVIPDETAFMSAFCALFYKVYDQFFVLPQEPLVTIFEFQKQYRLEF